MLQPSTSDAALPEQFTALFLALEKIAHTYFISGHLGQALQVLQAGAQLADIPEVRQQDRARFLLHYGNMLARKTSYENAPVEEALAVLAQVKQLAAEIHDEQTLADALDGIGFAHWTTSSRLTRRRGPSTSSI